MHWRASMHALVYKAHTVGRLSESAYRYYLTQMAKRGWRTKEPIELVAPKESPRIVRQVVRSHLGPLKYSLGDLGGGTGATPGRDRRNVRCIREIAPETRRRVKSIPDDKHKSSYYVGHEQAPDCQARPNPLHAVRGIILAVRLSRGGRKHQHRRQTLGRCRRCLRGVPRQARAERGRYSACAGRNANGVAGFTRRYGVHMLVFVEVHATIADAILREKRIKRWRRAWKLEAIERQNPGWRDLADDLAS